MAAVLDLRGVTKSFGRNQVLRGVRLAVDADGIYALMGANGAGKSTLIRILSGAHQADGGQILLRGEPVEFADPLAAQRAGIATVHQNPNDGVVLDMTVAENLALDTLTDRESPRLFARRRTEDHAREVAATLGLQLSSRRLRSPVRDLGVSDRQLLVLARALSRRPEILVLDEPTSALSGDEAERLFALIRSLRAGGMTTLFVTHKLAEIDQLADRLGVLRDGAMQGEFAPGAQGPEAQGYDWPVVLTALFDRAPAESTRVESPGGSDVLRLRGVQLAEDTAPFDLDLRDGEVTALLGLLGSGKTELLEWVFGAEAVVAGERTLDGAAFTPRHPADAIDAGVYLVPESRHEQAIVPGWTLARQLTLPFTRDFSTGPLISAARERAAAAGVVEQLGIVAEGPAAPIETLSGGNQQKTVVGRWLLGEPRVLLLDEPFRGVDINARHDIGTTIRGFTDRAAVLVATSDVDEAFEVADRIVVLSHGRITLDVRLSAATRESIIDAMSHRPSALLAAEPTEERL
jgi:simple sugar transport system ATP-binding protein